MLDTFAPVAGGRLNVDFGLTMLEGRAGVALSFRPRRMAGFDRDRAPDASVPDLPRGGEDLPGRRVDSAFRRTNVRRLSGDVRRDAVRESG